MGFYPLLFASQIKIARSVRLPLFFPSPFLPLLGATVRKDGRACLTTALSLPLLFMRGEGEKRSLSAICVLPSLPWKNGSDGWKNFSPPFLMCFGFRVRASAAFLPSPPSFPPLLRLLERRNEPPSPFPLILAGQDLLRNPPFLFPWLGDTEKGGAKRYQCSFFERRSEPSYLFPPLFFSPFPLSVSATKT